MASVLNWFEIPVSDMGRAISFYNTILSVKMTTTEPMPGMTMAMFPVTDGIGGALMHGEGQVPSAVGTLVYLNGGEDLNGVLGKVEDAGGQVVVPKMDIGENGFMAFFIDCEGNRVGLHSMG